MTLNLLIWLFLTIIYHLVYHLERDTVLSRVKLCEHQPVDTLSAVEA